MESKKRNKVLKVLGLVGLFVLVFGLSYALFRVTLTGRKKTRIKTANFKLELLDEDNNSIEKNSNNEYEYEINMDKVVPISDEEGTSQEGFTFKLKNSGNIGAKYTIYLDNGELGSGEERINDQYVKYSLIKNDSIDYPEPLTYLGTSNARKLDMGLIKAGETNEYTLKVWIDENAGIEASNKVFDGVLRVEGEQQTKGFKNNTFAKQIYEDNEILEIEDVPNGLKDNEVHGLYKYTDDDNTTTYAFRGTDVNNYVTFMGATWRIIRIQEDGTVKLINMEDEESPKYNKSYANETDNEYKGSDIETYVNGWYSNNFNTYGSKLTNNEYCSDKYEDTENSLHQVFAQYFGLNPNYGFINRGDATTFLQTGNARDVTIRPSVSCRAVDKVYRKVALVTADEYILSGGGITPDNSETISYLNKQMQYWTMSPAGWKINDTEAQGFYITNYISFMYTAGYGYFHPVITLKADISATSGDGTLETPYLIN